MTPEIAAFTIDINYLKSLHACEEGLVALTNDAAEPFVGGIVAFLAEPAFTWTHKKWLLLNPAQTVIPKEYIRAFNLMSGEALEKDAHLDQCYKEATFSPLVYSIDFSEIALEHAEDVVAEEQVQLSRLLDIIVNGVPSGYLHAGV